MKKATIIITVLFLILTVSSTLANTLHLTSGDTYIDNLNPTINHGSKNKIKLKKTNTQEIVAYLKYDFSNVPTDFNIDNVYEFNLKIWPDAITHAGSIEVYFIFGAWDEHTLIDSNKPTSIRAPSPRLLVPVAMADLNHHRK